MPSVSKSQRRFFGAILGGAAEKPKGLSMEQVRDFAATSEKGLLERVSGRAEHMADGNWMAGAFAHAGEKGHNLHTSLHIPAGQKIPVGRMDTASHSDSPHVRHQAQAALNARPARHRFKG